MKYTVIVSTVYNSDVLRACLRSLVSSDFSGDIILAEDGFIPDRQCEALAHELDIMYIKSPYKAKPMLVWKVAANATDADIIILSHSDVMFPPKWFNILSDAWDIDSTNVGIINTQYYGYYFDRGSIDHPTRLFLDNDYDALSRYMRDSRSARVITNDNQELLLAIGRDEHTNTLYPNGTACLISPVHSIRRDIIADMYMDERIAYESNMRVYTTILASRRWHLMATTPMFIHRMGTDVTRLAVDYPDRYEIEHNIYREMHGFGPSHFLSIVFSGTYMPNKDIIVEAANKGKLSSIRYILDDAEYRLLHDTCDTCDMTKCCNDVSTLKEHRTIQEVMDNGQA